MEHTNNRFNFEALCGFKKMMQEVWAGKSCSFFGVQNSLKTALSAEFCDKIIYITSDDVQANAAVSAFSLMGKKACLLPQISDSFLYKKATANERYEIRTKTLYNIISNLAEVVVCPVEALFNFLPDPKRFKENTFSLRCGKNYEIGDIEKRLIQAGYRREELIFSAGQFSRRGEVLDIFPAYSEVPYRLDFFDTEVESIKVLDLEKIKGTKEEKEIKICPCSDLFLSEKEVSDIVESLTKIKGKFSQSVDSSILFDAQVDELISRINLGERGYSLDLLQTYENAEKHSIFDYFIGQNFAIVIDECKQVYDRLTNYAKESENRVKELNASGGLLAKMPCFFTEGQVLENFKTHQAISFLKLTNTNRFYESQAVFSLKSNPCSKYTHNLKEFSSDVKKYLASGYSLHILAGNLSQAKSIQNILSSKDCELNISDNGSIFGTASAIHTAAYESGFVLNDEKVCVIGTYDLFAKKHKKSGLKSSKESVFTIPKVGDYVVHEFHGIGVCEGVTKLTGNLGTKDYIVIKYRDGDLLYVPTSGMDLISRFSGAEKPARLSKIGGTEFSAVKERVKKSVRELAINLTELYAKREQIQGFAFSEDNDLQKEFENAFIYLETEDQLTSAEEIKKDMESPKVMDRLLCGDVGFGKTEVALRACFKAIMDGKQVAFVAPTTILSEQHHNTAKARMQDFGISMTVLNRFKTKGQIEKALKSIKDGSTDLVFGTHRVFSKDVEFKNLGLIVLDEEQKFGVEDKEKLKEKYNNVDVLTLSATPIPRTLNMSLSGIRDISIISTPPSERLPIQTYVTEYSDALVSDAIKRELSRDGQVFILFNSVEKIYSFAERIKKIVPESEVMVAHGQMAPKQLEGVIYDFYSKKANVLVCTTIIENGIDIENANTLIVIDSDKLGLSQLYQIRGRVGRGSKMAYAYFTYDYHKSLTEEAYKRLDAMSEFCEFGSGFKLAMRDLEIRGGGNIFGAEQSGHMQKVGYDLYSKMLSDAVKELRGEKLSETKDVLIKVAIDAYVPDTYILTSEERMTAYKRISVLSSIEELEKLKSEIKESYGIIPEVVTNLMDISLVRQLSIKLCAIEVNSFGAGVRLVFKNKEDILKSEVLGEALFKFRLNCSVEIAAKPLIVFDKKQTCKENFEELKKFLLTASELLNKKATKN